MDAQMLEDVKSLLEAGRSRLLSGWCRDVLMDSNGNVCALGSMAYKGDTRIRFGSVEMDVYVAAVTVLHCKLPLYKPFTVWPEGSVGAMEDNVAHFNNIQVHSGPVVDLFDRAIQDVKQQIADAA